MVDVKAVKKITVTEQIMEQIATLITTGKLKPGEKLPTERVLAEKFNVTRSRVRESLRALSLIGLITIKPGEGSFVKESQLAFPAETITWIFHREINNLNEIYAARKLIESEVYLTAARNATDEQIEHLERLAENIVKIKGDDQPDVYLHHIDEFDLYMGEICGNSIYAKLMQTIIHLRKETSLKILSVPGSIEQSVALRSKLIESIKKHDYEQVQENIDTFFKHSRDFYDSILDS
ncbi:GntR family transcriptional regulator [Alkalihalobacillus oceani]|uniref:GntR family transcriptional regulator n=1 Tax=Halalkalibacter oceani TaxID=1653776 RepID=A0A9X2IRF2_9BACI|nr:GntR family transcriptional regulator [Halalkalibacter oceani]MCM3715523.1 GntR family transcriptional regulator [Halalkalibacter oceani]